ncbi:MAG: xanthine dehydrogenase family protein subunit M [Desulfotomaculaceae bacterium]|nr:xanthine dehydrogenase family protein subunit M [Desulfotomaculaceae bacterium]
MRLPKFQYLEPATLAETIPLLMEHQGRSKVIAGGTDLLVALKQRLHTPAYLISLSNLAALKGIREEDGMVTIGPLTTLEGVSAAPLIREKLPGLAQAAWEVGSPLLRPMATIGGNLCLDNRCRFYNQSLFWRSARQPCCKAGGKVCHVTNKENACFSTYSGDVAPVLIALQAEIKLVGSQGERILPLEQFYTGDGRRPNLIGGGEAELLTEIRIPLSSHTGCMYKKYRLRDSIDFPVVGVAVALRLDQPQGICREAKIVITGVGSRPVEATQAGEKLTGREMRPEFILAASETAAAEIHPVRTDQVGPSFKRHLVRVMVAEIIRELGGVDR